MPLLRSIRLLGMVTVITLVLSACAGAATPTAKPVEPTKPAAAAATTAPAAPTTAPAAAATTAPVAPAPAATGAAPAAGKEIVIGLFGPMSGNSAQYGKNFSQAINLATDDLNKAGGINGRPVKIVEADDRNDNKEAANIAERFASDQNMLAVIGGFSSAASLSAAPTFQKAGIPQLCPTCSHPQFTKEGGKDDGKPMDFVFSLSNPQALEGPFNARFTANTLGKKKVAVLWRKDDWGVAAKDQYEKAFKDLGGTVVLSEGLADDTKDFKPVLTKIKDLKPDVIYIALFYTDAAVMTQQAKQLGLDTPVVSSGSLYNIQFLNLAQGSADGMLLPTTFFPSEGNKGALDFARKYKERYNVEADNFAAHAYDSALVMFDALKRSDLTRKSVRDALATTKGFAGTTGVITFDADRRVAKDFTWLQVKNNDFTYYKTN